jgi:hypothetical protein
MAKKNREQPEWEEPEEQWDALEEHEEEGEPLEGPGKCESDEDEELRDGEDGEGWEEEERRAGEEGEEQL